MLLVPLRRARRVTTLCLLRVAPIWELSAGCGNYHAAWLLNTIAVVLALPFAPRRLWCAYSRGRRSTSLYRLGFDDSWLDEPVVALVKRLNL